MSRLLGRVARDHAAGDLIPIPGADQFGVYAGEDLRAGQIVEIGADGKAWIPREPLSVTTNATDGTTVRPAERTEDLVADEERRRADHRAATGPQGVAVTVLLPGDGTAWRCHTTAESHPDRKSCGWCVRLPDSIAAVLAASADDLDVNPQIGDRVQVLVPGTIVQVHTGRYPSVGVRLDEDLVTAEPGPGGENEGVVTFSHPDRLLPAEDR